MAYGRIAVVIERTKGASYMKYARNSDAAFFWIPAFAGMTSCPPFGFAQDRLRRASSVRAVWETRDGPCSGSERIRRGLHLIYGPGCEHITNFSPLPPPLRAAAAPLRVNV